MPRTLYRPKLAAVAGKLPTRPFFLAVPCPEEFHFPLLATGGLTMASGDVYQIRHVYNIAGRGCQWTQYYREVGDLGLDNPADNLVVKWVENILPLQQELWGGDVVSSYVYARRIRPIPGIPGLRITAVGGVQAFASLPAIATLVITFYGRINQFVFRSSPRLSGIAENFADSGILNDDGINRADQLVEGLQDALQASPGSPAGWQPCLNSIGSGTLDVSYATYRNWMGTQETRRPKAGSRPNDNPLAPP